ncbi:MAG: FecR domain-containing protein [Stenomitos frigidus ULC029]
MKRQAALVGIVFGAAVLLGFVTQRLVPQSLAKQSLQVRVNRWLEVRQITNDVTFERGAMRRAAVVGDRLQAVGDRLITGRNSAATLFVDTGVGVVEMAEKTTLRVRRLDVAADNGRITRLEVLIGNVRLRVRPFTHKGSQLEIQTPVGVSGVRGTKFGVAVQPNGKTGLAVLEGRVVSAAQNQAVRVAQGLQNFTMPREAPSTPVKLKDDTSLRYDFELIVERGVRLARLRGQVDPVNNVTVDGVPQVTDRQGVFQSNLRSMPSYLRMQVIVTTPLGKTKTYALALQ